MREPDALNRLVLRSLLAQANVARLQMLLAQDWDAASRDYLAGALAAALGELAALDAALAEPPPAPLARCA